MPGAVRNRSRLASFVLASLVLSLEALPAVAGGPPPSPAPSPPPPTPIQGTPSPFPTALHTPGRASRVPRIGAAEAVLEDEETGQVLFRKHATVRAPIASVTKIMTAFVVIQRMDPSRSVTASARAAAQTGSVLGLRVGERASVRDLLFALMLQSSNDAAVALGEAVSRTTARFVRLMNRTARALGLADTRFASPSGLDDRGYSSPLDLAALTLAAERLPLFARIVRTRFHTIPAPHGPARVVQNRNALLWLYPGAAGVKTGFTTAAGNCLVAVAERDGRSLAAVVLGDPRDPFDSAATLLNYGFTAFVPVTPIRQGQPIGDVTVEGRPVDAVAASGLVLLVGRKAGAPALRLVPLSGLRLPIRPGQDIGSIVVSLGGKPAGTVAAVAATGVDVRGRVGGASVGRQPLDDVLEVLRLLVRSIYGSFI